MPCARVWMQAVDARLKRKRVEVASSRLALAVVGDEALLASLPADERALIERLAHAESKAAETSPLHGVRATLVESGVLLYLHTAGGGAAWGLFESIRAGESRAMLVQNVMRTALVTCFVPILMVGGVVTAYNRFVRRPDPILGSTRYHAKPAASGAPPPIAAPRLPRTTEASSRPDPHGCVGARRAE